MDGHLGASKDSRWLAARLLPYFRRGRSYRPPARANIVALQPALRGEEERPQTHLRQFQTLLADGIRASGDVAPRPCADYARRQGYPPSNTAMPAPRAFPVFTLFAVVELDAAILAHEKLHDGPHRAFDVGTVPLFDQLRVACQTGDFRAVASGWYGSTAAAGSSGSKTGFR